MLQELLMNLVTASDSKEKEKALRKLEKVGVDRRTAEIMAAEFKKGGSEMNDMRTYVRFKVYYLDMWGNEDDGYEENERLLLGDVVVPGSRETVTPELVLHTLENETWNDPITGLPQYYIGEGAVETLYCNELYGDGLWYEVGQKSNGLPVFGLEYCGAFDGNGWEFDDKKRASQTP